MKDEYQELKGRGRRGVLEEEAASPFPTS